MIHLDPGPVPRSSTLPLVLGPCSSFSVNCPWILEEIMFAAGRWGHARATNPFEILDSNHEDLNQLCQPIASKASGPLLEHGAENRHNQSFAHTLPKHLQPGPGAVGSTPTWAKRTSHRLQPRKPLAPTTFNPPAQPQRLSTGAVGNYTFSPSPGAKAERSRPIESIQEALLGSYLLLSLLRCTAHTLTFGRQRTRPDPTP